MRKEGKPYRDADTAPLVSVVLPHYDDREHLPASMYSVLSQTYPNVELLIVDSSADSDIQELAGEYDSVRYMYQQPGGVAAARNMGIDEASGEYITFIDSDDSWKDFKIDAQMIEVKEGADFLWTDQYVETNGSEHRQSAFRMSPEQEPHVGFFKKGQGIGSRTVLVDAHLLDGNRFDTDLPGREDPHLWTRLLAEADRPYHICHPTATKLRRSDSLTQDSNVMYQAELAEIESLCGMYPEFEEYRKERQAEARFRHARRLLRDRELGLASEHLAQLIESGHRDYRILACYALSLLPARVVSPTFGVLERAQEGVKRVT